MISKKPLNRRDGKSSFRDLVNYCLGKTAGQDELVVYTNSRNIEYPEKAALYMEVVASCNVLCKKPAYHFILSWREHEVPSEAQVDEAVDISLRELGLEDCQAIWGLHSSRENRHLHVAVNRVHPETFKAISPDNGWDKKALERAARKIEIAQGWEILQNGRYTVTDDGQVIEKTRSAKTRLSQTARDIEAHTGGKSAERMGQETAAPIIRAAKSWDELHQKLAEQGIAFERKGSGAVIHIGDTIIKASQVGHDLSLSKLEKRLGQYQERGFNVKFGTPKLQAVERVEEEAKVKRSWVEYQSARNKFFTAKKNSLSELRIRQADERKVQKESQSEERTSFFLVSWKGKGRELNQHRSVMSAKHKNEKLNLRDRHKLEQKELLKRFPQKFPNFKTWLGQEDDPELAALYRYSGQLVLVLGDRQGNFTAGGICDLRNYSPVIGEKRGEVRYCRTGKQTADFIDYGKQIVISEKFDEASILAALQLSAQKWGSVKVNGSSEYKELCARVASEHGIKITNPELRRATEEAQIKLNHPEAIKTKIGQVVTFQPNFENSESLTGKVIAIDNDKRTVTLVCGTKVISLRADKGHFMEAAPIEYAQTKDHAIEVARRHIGESGSVYFARDDGMYRGPIISTTATFAIQKQNTNTIILHRLMDLKNFDKNLVSEKREVIINKVSGMGTISIAPERTEPHRHIRTSGLGR